MINHSERLDALFQALADPARRSMIERLGQGPASLSELASPLPMSLPAVMQHVSVLEQVGLVQSEKQGRVRICRLQPETLSQLEQWLNARRLEWQQRFDRLEDYLNETADGAQHVRET